MKRLIERAATTLELVHLRWCRRCRLSPQRPTEAERYWYSTTSGRGESESTSCGVMTGESSYS
jgi:hypothetical protein